MKYGSGSFAERILNSRRAGPIGASSGGDGGGGEPVSYDEDAQAYFDALDPQPSTGWKNAVNTFVEALKTNGFYSEMVLISIMACEDKSHAFVNLVDPTNVATDTTSGGDTPIIHTSNVGLQRHSTSGEMDWGNTPDDYGITETNVLMCAHNRTESGSFNPVFGLIAPNANTNLSYRFAGAGTTVWAKGNMNSVRDGTVATQVGLLGFIRQGSNFNIYQGTNEIYDGTSLNSSSPNSVRNVGFFREGTGLSTLQLAFGALGKSFVASDWSTFQGLVQDLLDDIEAL